MSCEEILLRFSEELMPICSHFFHFAFIVFEKNYSYVETVKLNRFGFI